MSMQSSPGCAGFQPTEQTVVKWTLRPCTPWVSTAPPASRAVAAAADSRMVRWVTRVKAWIGLGKSETWASARHWPTPAQPNCPSEIRRNKRGFLSCAPVVGMPRDRCVKRCAAAWLATAKLWATVICYATVVIPLGRIFFSQGRDLIVSPNELCFDVPSSKQTSLLGTYNFCLLTNFFTLCKFVWQNFQHYSTYFNTCNPIKARQSVL